jgi:cytochrome P450
MIAERRANGCDGRTDFLSRLMLARDEEGMGMSDRQLRDETLTLLLAGHETTALALSWTFHLLGQDAEIRQRLAAEIRDVAGDRVVTVDPRICIGQRFAMIEAMLILATIAQRFDAKWLPERPVIPFPSITLRPKGGVWVRLSGDSGSLH